MMRILLWLTSQNNYTQLTQPLGEHYQILLQVQEIDESKNVAIPANAITHPTDHHFPKTIASPFSIPFDLCIIEEAILADYASALQARKAAEDPVFLPCLLLSDRESVAGTLQSWRQLVDDVIVTPWDPLELQTRVENLLRSRRLSLGLHQRMHAETWQARTLLWQSEERFRLLVESLRDYAIFILDSEGYVVSWNTGAERIMGYRSDEIIGAHFSCFYLSTDIQSGKPQKELQLVLTAGQCEDEGPRVRKDGTRFWANMTITALRDGQGKRVGFSVITHDLSPRKQIEEELCRANRSLTTLVACNQALVRATEESELLHEICRIIVEVGGYRLAWVGFPEMDAECSVQPVAQAGYEAGYLESLNLSWDKTRSGRRPTGMAIRTGQACVVQNILTDPSYAPWRAEAIQRRYASAIALPLIDKTAKETADPVTDHLHCLGVLTIYAAEPDAFDLEEVHLLEELADDLTYGIMALRARAEALAAETALAKSEERYRQLIEFLPEAILVLNHHHQIDYINTAGTKLLAAEQPEQLIGRSLLDSVHPEDQEMMQTRLGICSAAQQAVPFVEQKLMRLDGTSVDMESAATPLGNAERSSVLVVARDIGARKAMEAALRNSEELHRITLSNISEAILIADSDGYLTYICPNAHLFFNASPEEVCQFQHISQFLGDRLFDPQALEAQGEIHNIEREISNGHGGRTTLLVSVKRVSIQGGTVLYTCRDISDRKRAEQALRENERLLRTVLETLPVGVYFTDDEGKFLQANRAVRQIWAGFRFVDLQHYDTYQGWWADTGQPIAAHEWPVARAIIRGETSINEIIDIKCFDGTDKTILNSAVPLLNAQQEIYGAIGVIQDITELRHAQDALQESNRQIANILESITDAFFAVDKNWCFTYVNHQAENFLQKKRKELIGKTLWEEFPEAVNSVFFEEYHQALFRGSAVSFEGFYEPLDNWFEVHAYPGKDGLAVYFQNVSDRKKAQEALKESERQFRAVFDGALDAMVIADDDGNYVEVNSSACNLFGLTKSELVGCHLTDFVGASKFDFEPTWRNFIIKGNETGEFILRRSDGTIIEVEYSAVANFLPGRHLSVIRDISQRKRAAEELQKYRDQLEELVSARTAELTAANAQLQREIEQRQFIEFALRESEEQLRSLINAMPDFVCFKDGAGRWLEANQAAIETFNLYNINYRGQRDSQLAQLILAHHQTPAYSEAMQMCESSDESAWQGGKITQVEEIIPTANGTVRIFETIKVPLFHPEGRRKGLVVIGRDITERKQAEEKLIRLASIVESSDDAIIGQTFNGDILSWNNGAQQIYGYSAEEVKGCSIEILFTPNRPNELPRILERIQQGGSIDHYETIHLKKDGHEIDVSLTFSPIKDTTDKVIGVSTIARDITDRSRVEAALERLRHQNELILNSAGEGICGLDYHGRITFINPAATRMLGYDLGELIAQPMHVLVNDCYLASHAIATDQLYTEESCPIYASLKDGSIHHVTNALFRRRDTSCCPVEYVSTPILEQGKIVGAVVTFKDITERQAIERMKNEFISVVSHELRTPLTSIRGSLGLLASGLLNEQPERAKRMLEIAVTNTDRLVRLINDILDLERMSSGQLYLAKQLCDVGELINQSAEAVQPLAEKAGVTLSLAPISVSLWADPDRIIQTLTNLLSNAIKFSAPGTTVHLSAEKRDQPSALTHSHRSLPNNHSVSHSTLTDSNLEEVLFFVQDHGRGIPPDKIESIFGRFQQVDASDSRQKGGTGLGLSICRSIVQHHGGRIWVESTLGEGSTFYFTLPVQKTAEIAVKSSTDDIN